MTLAEAKVKCAACHQPGGSGSAVWDKANGTETDWAAFAPAAKASVSAGRMPLGGMSADEKTRMLTFLDRLMGVTSTPGGMPAPIVYNFTTARTLCVGCHSSQAPRAQRQSPYLETETQWRNNKRKIEREVDGGTMPEGKILSNEERAALLTFIRSL